MSIQALRERRNAVSQNIRAMMKDTDGKAWTPENQSAYDTGMKELDDINAEIKRHEDFMAKLADEGDMEANERLIHAAGKKAKNAKSPIAQIHAKWLRGGNDAVSAEEWNALRAAIANTMSVGTPAQGGYTVPTEVISEVVDALKFYGSVRQVATVIKTETGHPLSYPTSDGTSELGEQVAENATASGADVSFGAVALNTYKYSSKIFTVPFELLQDTAVDLDALINKRALQRISRITEQKFMQGTGTNEPKGLLAAVSAGVVAPTGSTTSVTYDSLINLIHSVDPAYRALTPGFMLHDSTLREIRKLKDANGRPIFLPGFDGLGGKMADTILGYDVTINQFMPQMAPNALSILFGDFSFYVVRDVMQAQMFRFYDSAYVANGQVGFLMWMRAGGAWTDVGGAVKAYQNSAT